VFSTDIQSKVQWGPKFDYTLKVWDLISNLLLEILKENKDFGKFNTKILL